jgi:hypothetical protein
LDRVGNDVDGADVRTRCPEVDWHDFGTWAKEQDWTVLRNAN